MQEMDFHRIMHYVLKYFDKTNPFVLIVGSSIYFINVVCREKTCQ